MIDEVQEIEFFEKTLRDLKINCNIALNGA